MNGSPSRTPVLFLWPEELQSLLLRALDARSAGLLSDGQMVGIARSLVAGDGTGRLWTVGLRSGLFYRWEGSSWVEDEPRGRLLISPHEGPAQPRPETAVPAQRSCPACGTTVRSEARFCTACGAEAQTG